MGARWDRSSPVYLEEWLPRFVPYQLDLVAELAVREGDRVLLPRAGPDVSAFARAVGDKGRVRATEPDPLLRRTCERRLDDAGLRRVVTVVEAPEHDTADAPFDVVACAFGLRHVSDRRAALAKWASALEPQGKLALMIWGPVSADDPEEWVARSAREVDPALDFGGDRLDTERGALSFLLESAGLALVRHTVVRHVVTFRSADAFVTALREASEWRDVHATLDSATAARITARVCELAGGPDRPVVFDPAATIAIAGLPGAEIELPHRPSVRIPAVKGPT